MSPLRVAYLVSQLVDVTRTKAQDTSHGPMLSAADHQDCDYSVMG